tara:strand:+ start:570 stop:944 length:375 start_codon:yes stop_codon:yes gene_type:complete
MQKSYFPLANAQWISGRDTFPLNRIQCVNPTHLKIIPFNKIMWQDKHNIAYRRDKTCRCCGGLRYEQCDIRFPGILYEQPPNSYNEIYKVLDGCHRIQKMIDQGLTEGVFFVMTREEYNGTNPN